MNLRYNKFIILNFAEVLVFFSLFLFYYLKADKIEQMSVISEQGIVRDVHYIVMLTCGRRSDTFCRLRVQNPS